MNFKQYSFTGENNSWVATNDDKNLWDFNWTYKIVTDASPKMLLLGVLK
jgi:hypothetical protein